MGKTMGKLTAAKVKSIAKPGMHGDGGGLYLRVAPGGSRQWIARLTIKGKRRDLGLGGYPAVSLAKARELATAARASIAEGRDPIADRRQPKMPTFREAAEAVHAANLPRWRPGKQTDQWLRMLSNYAFPVIGDMPVDRIGREDVLRVLSPIWGVKPETARRVRQRVRAALKWAQAHGHIEHNPAGEMIDGALPPMPKTLSHLRAVPYRDVAAALAAVEASGAWPMTKACLRFAVLTAARSGEARGATWAEIDIEAAAWSVPAHRMKMGKAHRVPLSDAALTVLEAARPFRDESGLVFPSQRGKMLSDSTVSKVLRDLGIAGTPHGFRSSFRDWCAETGKPRDVAEAALAHTVGGVEGAYFRSDLFDRRRRLMADWARYLSHESAKVVQLHG